MKLTRRGLLAGAAVGGGLLVAWSLVPRSYPSPLDPADGEAAFDAWLKIASDGVVTVAVPQLEMGQGVTTVLPQIVAMELGADWRQVAVEPAPVSGAYANLPLAAEWAPLWQPLVPALADEPEDLLLTRWAQSNRFSATAGGTTLAAYELPCREAAASARAMLTMAAAERWDVPWEECTVEDGFVMHGEQRASLGELALAAAALDPPEPPPLRSAPPAESAPGPLDAELRQIAFPRLDLPSKVDGSFQFAGDIRLPGMLYAAIRHGPIDQAELVQFDPQGAAGVRGLAGIVRGKRWLAAAAETWWAAERAVEAMRPNFSAENLADSDAIALALDEAIEDGTGIPVQVVGEGAAAVEPVSLALRYHVAPAAHGTIETASCTVRLTEGRCELWLAAQAPERARQAVARALGLSAADVVHYPMPAGGSFDRRLEDEHAIEAALIAREVGRPVQLVWSRGEEHRKLHPRPPAAGQLGARLTPDGRIAAFRARIATPPAALEFGRRLFGNRTTWAAIEEVAGEADPMAVEGALPPYAIPSVSIEHIPVSLPLPSGRMRANAHGITCFMTESFLDEVAERGGLEPLSFRISMLSGDTALAECLQRAARLGEWDGGGAASGKGIACHRMRLGTATGRIALVATARAGQGGVRVRQLSAAVDIGRVVNRDIALQQIEGGLLYGLGLALGSSLDYVEGVPDNLRLAGLMLPTLTDTPEIAIDLVESDAEPFDPGEIGVPPVAPAIANALHSATGLRFRRLPLLSGGL